MPVYASIAFVCIYMEAVFFLPFLTEGAHKQASQPASKQASNQASKQATKPLAQERQNKKNLPGQKVFFLPFLPGGPGVQFLIETNISLLDSRLVGRG